VEKLFHSGTEQPFIARNVLNSAGLRDSSGNLELAYFRHMRDMDRGFGEVKMNIYMIEIWGPCETTEEVGRLRNGSCTDEAVVFAPTKDVANQLCYLVSTRDMHFKPNYQQIDTFPHPISCILHTNLMPVTFTDEIANGLTSEPLLPPVKTPDTQAEPGALFFARCIDESKETEKILKAEFWVYDRDSDSARRLASAYGATGGFFDPAGDRIDIELIPMTKACVFWNVKKIAEGCS
jgi:hypothetical protein